MSRMELLKPFNQIRLSSSDIPLFAICVLMVYTVYGAIYRLFLSPLAKVPGPRLAALTDFYEWYYDTIKRGRYTWKIAELHKQYGIRADLPVNPLIHYETLADSDLRAGPIVRINPWAVHIHDPDFIDEVYPGAGRKVDKPSRYANMFGISVAAFATDLHEKHRVRRGLLNSFFSKRSIAKLEPVIQSVVDKLCDRLEGFRKSGEPLNLRNAYMALGTDVINQYCFSASEYYLDEPDFHPTLYQALIEASEGTANFHLFPWLFPILNSFPHWFMKVTNPKAYNIIEMLNIREAQIRDLMAEGEEARNKAEHTTIFHYLLDEEVPPQERTLFRLGQEAISLIGAGGITTQHTLQTLTYHILANPPVLAKLMGELKRAMPDPNVSAPLQQLEHLPYLSAVISEGLRVGYGISHRMERSFPDRALKYGDHVIPPNTSVSMTTMLIHDDPTIFPEPRKFIPERWLDSAKQDSLPTPDNSDREKPLQQQSNAQRLNKYLLSFSRGSRACVGLNLAQAELHLALANIFRKFDLELFEVVRERDVDVKHDFFNPAPAKESVGLRVRVVGRVA